MDEIVNMTPQMVAAIQEQITRQMGNIVEQAVAKALNLNPQLAARHALEREDQQRREAGMANAAEMVRAARIAATTIENEQPKISDGDVTGWSLTLSASAQRCATGLPAPLDWIPCARGSWRR